MRKTSIKVLSLLLVVMTLVGIISVPVSASIGYPMNYTITYKTKDGKTLGTKTGTVDGAADTRNALRISSPSYDGYVLSNDNDATVTGSMISWSFPASHYVRHGSGSYTVYYEKACRMIVHYVYGSTRRQASADKTVTGKNGSSYSISSPTISGYTPTKSTVTGTYSSESSSTTVYYYESTYKVAIIKGGKLIRSGTMEEVKGDDSLEDVFLELEGEGC